MKFDLQECRSWIKLGAVMLSLGCLLTASILPEGSHSIAVAPGDAGMETIRIYTDEKPYMGRAVLYEDTTYVDMEEYVSITLSGKIVRDETARCATYIGENIEISVVDGTSYLCANGRYLWCPRGVFVTDDAVYVPVRVLVQALGGEVIWREEDSSVHIKNGKTPISAGEDFYDADEVLWLSRIIYAEAGIEPFEGQIAVGNVVLNRVRSDAFPDTIYDVIFDRSCGVQFSPTANGTIYCIPDEDAIIAAKLCLEGYTVSEDILYFINGALASNFWVPQNCQYVMTIQSHDFYS